ncbi:MAG TPA: nodulation protein NodZ [Candidatus Kryptonia bacterium]|nr:nodulation protein NodZ [Candidatus Kryptonia bacterium]
MAAAYTTMDLDRIGRALRNPIIIARYLNAGRKRLYFRYRQRNNRGVCSVHMNRSVGFFAQLGWYLYISAFCDEHNLIPHVSIANPLFTDPQRGPDCFAYYFHTLDPAFVAAHVVETTHIRTIHQLGLPTRCLSPTIARAAVLAQRYLRVRPEINDEVERFCRAHFEGAVVLGVHFRGTDKHSEAPRVSYEQCGGAVKQFLNRHPAVNRLFVASDESRFIQYMQAEFPSRSPCYCEDQRSEGQLAVHDPGFGGDNYKKGREALVNCLLLSRCSALIRTASALSGWASVFNPQLPVVMLNQPYPETCWFPDRLVMARATLAAL